MAIKLKHMALKIIYPVTSWVL
ncbi:hypothetical protein BREVUG8_40252 [Brevundimonas sp. G8]|nr:hypothetical protein BREVUG8_40252 [Brevundimonas sp. G8]